MTPRQFDLKRARDMHAILEVLKKGPNQGMTARSIYIKLRGTGKEISRRRIRELCEEMSWERYNLVVKDKSRTVCVYKPTEFKEGQLELWPE